MSLNFAGSNSLPATKRAHAKQSVAAASQRLKPNVGACQPLSNKIPLQSMGALTASASRNYSGLQHGHALAPRRALMKRRDTIKALGLSGFAAFGASSISHSGQFRPSTQGDLAPGEINLRNSPQFVMTNTDAPEHVVDFYWSISCKFSAITEIETIKPLSADAEVTSKVAVRYTMIPRYPEEVMLGAVMLSVPPESYPQLCFKVLADAFRSQRGFLTPKEVTTLAKQMGASDKGSSGFQATMARESLELANDFFVRALRERGTPVVFVDGQKLSIDVSAPSAHVLRKALT